MFLLPSVLFRNLLRFQVIADIEPGDDIEESDDIERGDMLAGFDSQLGHTKDFQNGICCFSCLNKELRRG